MQDIQYPPYLSGYENPSRIFTSRQHPSVPNRVHPSESEVGINSTGLHEVRFLGGAKVLSDQQLILLASVLGVEVEEQSPKEMTNKMRALLSPKIRHRIYGARQPGVSAEPCTSDMAFRRRYV